jgi:energy-converting hydrogenase A subunit M
MSGYLYQNDLSSMKLAILASTRHDRMVREIASELGIPQIRLRKRMMDRFDMLLLENLPARYEQGMREREQVPRPGRELGAGIYTRAVPLILEDDMDAIAGKVRLMIAEGRPPEEAVEVGRAMIRELITR